MKGLDLLNPKVKAGVFTGLDKVRLMIERDAKILSPIATGRLRASITSNRTGLHCVINDNVVYGVYQEFGTSKMRAQPFMRPAFDITGGKSVEIAIRQFKGTLKEYLKFLKKNS